MQRRLVIYRPQAVHIPEGTKVQRTFDGFDLSEAELALCDRSTIFSDVFLSSRGDELLCIGPPFANLGRPERVLLQGRAKSFTVVGPRQGRPRCSFLRVRLRAADRRSMRGATVDLRVTFRDFEVAIPFRPGGLPTQEPIVSLTLATMQKDNDVQWLRDWCAWHHRVHGVGRVIFYDNGSKDAPDLYADLFRRTDGFDLVVVHWDYPYGPWKPQQLHYAQTVALNHCRLAFGRQTRWCINLDVDEYLYNASGEILERYLARSGHPVASLASYDVPMLVDKNPGRCFDSPWRSKVTARNRKYAYQPSDALFNEVHHVVPPTRTPGVQRAVQLLRAFRMEKAAGSVLAFAGSTLGKAKRLFSAPKYAGVAGHGGRRQVGQRKRSTRVVLLSLSGPEHGLEEPETCRSGGPGESPSG